MAPPPLYLDECVDHRLAGALRKRGFAVYTALDQGMTELPDEAQLEYAATRGWVLVTHNGRHFRRLHDAWALRGREHQGILVLPERPPLELLETRAAMLLDWVATLPLRRSSFNTWGQLQGLLERGHRLQGYSDAQVRFAVGQPGRR